MGAGDSTQWKGSKNVNLQQSPGRVIAQDGPQSQFLACDADICIFGGAMGGSKALDLNTPIPTPSGWSTIGEIKAGDHVYDEFMTECVVLEAHPVIESPNRCYRLHFGNGDKIDACGDHLWKTEWCGSEAVRTTDAIVESYCDRTGAFTEHRIRTPYSRVSKSVPIIRVERIDPKPMRCLTVSSPSSLFLVGYTCIPTHNTFSLLLNCLMYRKVRGFASVIFRRMSPQITNAGGLWDESMKIFPNFCAVGSRASLDWAWPEYGSTVSFRHLQHEKDKLTWMGAQICMIGFDELTHFLESQFWFLLSRNRSVCGVRPFVRATCNPVPADDPIGGWVHRLIQWWIDEKTGFPIDDRAGVIRWMARIKDEIQWGDTEQELKDRFPGCMPKSITFIPSKLEDNKILMEKDPGYEANLLAMSEVEKQRNKDGNWNVKMRAGMFFKVDKIGEPQPVAPINLRTCRAWDLAATDSPDADWTVGMKLGIEPDGTIWILDVKRGQLEANARDKLIKQTAVTDGRACTIRIPEDPGAAGKVEAGRLVRMLNRFTPRAKKVTGSKTARAAGFAAQVNAGNVRMVAGPWNAGLLSRLDAFPTEGVPDDEVDAASDSFDELVNQNADVIVGTGEGTEPDPEQQSADHPYKSLLEDNQKPEIDDNNDLPDHGKDDIVVVA